MERKGLLATKESCWSYYVQKCRNNLHVVLAMSPVGETLRTRCRNFPGMVNNTVIDWFEPWPEQALQSVATVFLAEEALPEAVRAQIVEHMVLVHQSVRTFSTRFLEELRRHNYVTPKVGRGVGEACQLPEAKVWGPAWGQGLHFVLSPLCLQLLEFHPSPLRHILHPPPPAAL